MRNRTTIIAGTLTALVLVVGVYALTRWIAFGVLSRRYAAEFAQRPELENWADPTVAAGPESTRIALGVSLALLAGLSLVAIGVSRRKRPRRA